MNTVTLFLLLTSIQTADGPASVALLASDCNAASVVIRDAAPCVPVELAATAEPPGFLWPQLEEAKSPQVALIWSLAGTGALFIPGGQRRGVFRRAFCRSHIRRKLAAGVITSSIRAFSLMNVILANDTERALNLMVAAWFVTSIYDVATAPGAARRFNLRNGLSVIPVYDPATDQKGVRVAVRF